LGELLIPVPSIDAQTAIVERLKELKGSIFALDCCETEKLLLVETLRQSLLQKAFSGELTR
jgi:type I restriction enzyme S subunit